MSYEKDKANIDTTLKLLLIEDNMLEAKVIADLLKRKTLSKISFINAFDLAESINCLKKFKFNAIVCDLNLPDSKGIETLIAIREAVLDTPIIVLTGNDEASLGLEAMRNGADDYLIKGRFSAGLLERSIMYSIERKKFQKTFYNFKQLEQICDSSINAKRLIDNYYNIIKVNKTFCELVGLKKEKLIGKKCYDVFTINHDCRLNCPAKKAFKQNNVINDELEKQTDENTKITCLFKATPFLDNNGIIIGVIEDFIDISYRKEIENKLKEKTKELSWKAREINCLYNASKLMNEDKLPIKELFFNILNILLSSFECYENISAQITFENTNVETNNFVKTKWKQYSHLVVNKKKIGRLEVFYERKIKSKSYYKEFQNLIDELSCKISHYLEHKQTEETLNRERTQILSLFDSINQGINVIDMDTHEILYVNQYWKDLLGKDPLGKKCYEELQGSNEPCSFCTNEIIKVNEGKPHYWECYYKKINTHFLILDRTIKWVDGRDVRFEMSININSLKDAEKDKERLIEELRFSVDKEIKAKIKMEKAYNELEKVNMKLENTLIKAEESSRLKNEFLAIISHELRTPISAMIGFSEILSNDNNLTCSQKESVDYILKSGHRLLNVVSDILKISVIEAGKIKLDYSEFNIKNLIDDVFILEKKQLIGNDIQIKINVNGICTIYSDQSRLRLILLNLIGNAIKFTVNGEISINVNLKKDYYVFEVKDTGIGIDNNDKEVIFDIFRQAEGSLRRKYEGTGLGLTISKKLVLALGGNIWVESKFGQGSSFYFTIPCVLEKCKIQALKENYENTVNEANSLQQEVMKFINNNEKSKSFLNDNSNTL